MTTLPRLWHDFVAAHPEHAGEQPEVEPFGDTAEMADELAQLVLEGTKRATAEPRRGGRTAGRCALGAARRSW